MKAENKYTSLMNNTFIFAISTISSKLMVFLLMPLYTRLLTPADYAVMDIIVQSSNLIIPLVFVGMSEAVIRYSLDKSVRKSDVFTVGITTCLKGFVAFLLLLPLLTLYEHTADYIIYIYLYVISACLRGVCTQFTRGIGYVRLYAFDSVFATITILIFNVIFMVVFRLGVTGYILSIIFSNLISVLFLALSAKLHRYFKPINYSKKVRRQMISYALPLIPTTIFWWIMNVSDRYLVEYFTDATTMGLYSASYKIPTIIFLISSIFTQAWQLSAISEYDQKDKDKFYSRVFNLLMSAVFSAASFIILAIKPFTFILMEASYHSTTQTAVVLVLAMVFSCFCTFYSSFYMASKKNNMSLVTTLVGAVMNLLLNILMIPIIGAQGAAVSTFISYFSVFVFRVIDTRRFVKLKINYTVLMFNLLAVILQIVSTLVQVQHNWLVQLLLFIFILLLNLKSLLITLIHIYEKYSKRKK